MIKSILTLSLFSLSSLFLSGCVTSPDSDSEAVHDSITLNEDTTASVSVLSNDVDVESVTFASNGTNGTTVIEGSNIKYTPNANFNGTDTFTYKGMGKDDKERGATVTVTVVSVNDMPTVSTLIDLIATNGSPASYTVTGGFSDIDSSNLTYVIDSSVALPAGLSFNTTTGIISGSPTTTATTTIKISATDGSLSSVLNPLKIIVSDVVGNNPPMASTIPNTTVPVTNSNSITISNYFSDPDSDTLTYEVKQSDDAGLPSWITLDQANSLVITPVAEGSVTLVATANDGTDSTSSNAFIVTAVPNSGEVMTGVTSSFDDGGASSESDYQSAPTSYSEWLASPDENDNVTDKFKELWIDADSIVANKDGATHTLVDSGIGKLNLMDLSGSIQFFEKKRLPMGSYSDVKIKLASSKLWLVDNNDKSIESKITTDYLPISSGFDVEYGKTTDFVMSFNVNEWAEAIGDGSGDIDSSKMPTKKVETDFNSSSLRKITLKGQFEVDGNETYLITLNDRKVKVLNTDAFDYDITKKYKVYATFSGKDVTEITVRDLAEIVDDKEFTKKPEKTFGTIRSIDKDGDTYYIGVRPSRTSFSNPAKLQSIEINAQTKIVPSIDAVVPNARVFILSEVSTDSSVIAKLIHVRHAPKKPELKTYTKEMNVSINNDEIIFPTDINIDFNTSKMRSLDNNTKECLSSGNKSPVVVFGSYTPSDSGKISNVNVHAIRSKVSCRSQARVVISTIKSAICSSSSLSSLTTSFKLNGGYRIFAKQDATGSPVFIPNSSTSREFSIFTKGKLLSVGSLFDFYNIKSSVNYINRIDDTVVISDFTQNAAPILNKLIITPHRGYVQLKSTMGADAGKSIYLSKSHGTVVAPSFCLIEPTNKSIVESLTITPKTIWGGNTKDMSSATTMFAFLNKGSDTARKIILSSKVLPTDFDGYVAFTGGLKSLRDTYASDINTLKAGFDRSETRINKLIADWTLSVQKEIGFIKQFTKPISAADVDNFIRKNYKVVVDRVASGDMTPFGRSRFGSYSHSRYVSKLASFLNGMKITGHKDDAQKIYLDHLKARDVSASKSAEYISKYVVIKKDDIIKLNLEYQKTLSTIANKTPEINVLSDLTLSKGLDVVFKIRSSIESEISRSCTKYKRTGWFGRKCVAYGDTYKTNTKLFRDVMSRPSVKSVTDKLTIDVYNKDGNASDKPLLSYNKYVIITSPQPPTKNLNAWVDSRLKSLSVLDKKYALGYVTQFDYLRYLPKADHIISLYKLDKNALAIMGIMHSSDTDQIKAVKIYAFAKDYMSSTNKPPMLSKEFLQNFKSKYVLESNIKTQFVSLKNAWIDPNNVNNQDPTKLKIVSTMQICDDSKACFSGRLGSMNGTGFYFNNNLDMSKVKGFTVTYLIGATDSKGLKSPNHLKIIIRVEPKKSDADAATPYEFKASYVSMASAFEASGQKTLPKNPNEVALKMDIYINPAKFRDSSISSPDKLFPVRFSRAIVEFNKDRFEPFNGDLVIAFADNNKVIQPTTKFRGIANSISNSKYTKLFWMARDPYACANCRGLTSKRDGKLLVGSFYLNPVDSSIKEGFKMDTSSSYTVGLINSTTRKNFIERHKKSEFSFDGFKGTLTKPPTSKFILKPDLPSVFDISVRSGDTSVTDIVSKFVNTNTNGYKDNTYSIAVSNWNELPFNGEVIDGKIINAKYFYPKIVDGKLSLLAPEMDVKLPVILTVKNKAGARQYQSINFIVKKKEFVSGKDPLNAYHLKNTLPSSSINVQEVYDMGITGKGVDVSVVDLGASIRHPDLRDNFVKEGSYNFHTWAKDKSDTTRINKHQHGTNTSGTIGAVKGNSIASHGVAPGVKLRSFNWLEKQSNENFSKSMGFGDLSSKSDIFNNSYSISSSTGHYVDSFKSSILTKGTKLGRDGKGFIYIKSSGNSHSRGCSTSYPTSKYDSTGGYASKIPCGTSMVDASKSNPSMIVVGAITNKNQKSSFSSTGSNLWVTAPGSDVMTTSVSAGKYGHTSISGTSFSAPIVAGVTALMLEANPKLKWRDIKHILALTSNKVNTDLTPFSINVGGAMHVVNQQWVKNAAGHTYNNWFGFGKVDAKKAVDMAKSFKTDEFNLSDQQIKTFSNYTANLKVVPDSSVIGNSIPLTTVENNAGKGIVETVTLGIGVTATNFADVSIEVTSPSGTKSILWAAKNANKGKNFSLTSTSVLTSNAFYGEESEGVWTAKVLDLLPNGVTKTTDQFKFSIATRERKL